MAVERVVWDVDQAAWLPDWVDVDQHDRIRMVSPLCAMFVDEISTALVSVRATRSGLRLRPTEALRQGIRSVKQNLRTRSSRVTGLAYRGWQEIGEVDQFPKKKL